MVHLRGGEIQNETGLSAHTPVTFSDISHFKCVLYHSCISYCKICFDPECVQTVGHFVTCLDCMSHLCLNPHKKPKWRPIAGGYVSKCDMHKRNVKSVSGYTAYI